MRNVLTLLFFAVLYTSISCAQRNRASKATTSAPSLCGTVVEKRGNQMPGPDRPQSSGQLVVREIVVLPLLTLNQVVSDEVGFVTDLKGAQPVQTVRSGTDGRFCFSALPAGRYSVMVREARGLYANSYDTQNHINPITVEGGKATTIALQITHQAAF